MESFVSEFKALEDLFTTEEEEEKKSVEPSPATFTTPADIGASSEEKQESDEAEDSKKGSGAIWDEDEVKEPEAAIEEDPDDDRPTPEYEIFYKQKVRSEDVFLGIDGKTPSTFDSENIVVRVKLPNTKGSDLQLDVTRKHFLLKTPKYRLSLPLPHNVFDRDGNAKWISDKCTLDVTLPIDRSDDYERE